MSKDARLFRDPHQKEIVRLFSAFDGSKNRRQIFDDFLWMAAIAISNSADLAHRAEREDWYRSLEKKYKPEDMKVFGRILREIVDGLEENPDQDFLGEMYMALDFGASSAGQFFTPYSICRTMAATVADFDRLKAEIAERGFVGVCDPACGAGALLMAFANECLRQGINYQRQVLFVAQDLDQTVACMCYIGLSLMGCPGYVVAGDTLAHPAVSRDRRGLLPVDAGKVWFTPSFMTSEDWTARKFAALFEGGRGEAKEKPAPPEPATPASAEPKAMTFEADETGQLSFF